jgi:type II secretory pathway component GspD/PulD (secretin)
MADFLLRCKRFRFVQSALWVMLPSLVQADLPSIPLENESQLVAASSKQSVHDDSYRINFNNIGIIEYIRFVSKITGSNFVFDEADLQFAVTIVSEEPATPENVFSALIQVLRINNLNILEQNGNYIITKSIAVAQIPDIVTGDEKKPTTAALVTRVFRIHNANIDSVAGIIRTMVSAKALVSVLQQTKQLIISDITTNIEKIASLLTILDSPHSNLEIESYAAKHIAIKDLVALAQQIVTPFSEGNPLIYVPQSETNSIFIISTPFLIERSITVLEDLDLPVQSQIGAPSQTENLFLYKIRNRPESEILESIKETVEQLQGADHPPIKLLAMLKTGRYIKDSNSIIFIGDSDTFNKIQEILTGIDIPGKTNEKTFLFYSIRNVSPTHLLSSIHDFVSQLKASSAGDPRFIDALESVKYLMENNALIFTGQPDALAKVQQSMTTLDIVPENPGGQFLVYRLKNNNLEQIQNSLKELVDNLKKSATPDLPLVHAIATMQYVADSDSLIFTGDRTTLSRLEQILPSFDLAESPNKITFYVYQPSKASERQIKIALEQFVSSLKAAKVPDTPLITSIQAVKFLPETQSFIFSGSQATLNRLSQILPSMDDAAAKKELGSFYVYPIKNLPQDILQDALRAFADKLASSGNGDAGLQTAIKNATFVKETNSLYFSGTPSAIERLQQILPSIDIPSAAYATNQSSFYLYTPKNASAADLEAAIKNLIENLKNASHIDTALVQTLQSGKYNKDTNAFTFTGTPDAIARVQQVLPSLDVSPQSAKSSYYLYRIKSAKIDNLKQSLDLFVKNLQHAPSPDQSLIEAIQSMRFIKETNSVVFTGEQSALDRLTKLMPDFDVVWSSTLPVGLPASNEFYIYIPTYRKGPQMMDALKEMTHHLQESGLADPSLIRTLETAKWVPSSNSVVFTGDETSLANLKKLLPTIDTPLESDVSQQIFLYRPLYLSYQEIEVSLRGLTNKLDSTNPGDMQLKKAISAMHWEEPSQSIAFRAPAATIDRVKQLLAEVDIPPEGGVKQQTYFLYKLQYASPDGALKYLDKIASNLSGNATPHKALVQAIHNIKVVPENNALLITGESSTVEQVKQLLAQYDNPSAAQPAKSSVFIYKPKYLSTTDLQSTLVNLISDLSKTATLDPQLLETVKAAKPIEANQSIAFSGSAEINDQIKSLINEIDTPEAMKAIHHVGAMTFYIYKLQYASASQLSSALDSVADDLSKGGVGDKELIQAIRSLKWIKETNSVLFTGTDTALQKVQTLIQKFDIPSMAPSPVAVSEPVGDYAVYQPQYRSGEELIEMLCEFENNLRLSGVNSPGLTSAISNLRWMESTCSLIISGDLDSIAKIQGLLKQFDVPSAEQSMIGDAKSIGETSFLIYKLQYHQGDDIRIALRKVAEDLSYTHKGQSLPVANAIDAMQWIPVTNSLLTSGPPDILTKVRELIQNLDVPLRQVFLEILIVQTSLSNTQSIGLSWSGRLQYKNKAGIEVGNFQPNDPLVSAGYGGINASTTPNVNMFPTNQGLDLGVIGDIIFNRGKSFVSLGSFIQALEEDNDTTLLTNPKVIAQDSNNALIFFGQNIPFTGSVTQTAATSITTSASLEYRNIGNSISITPTLGNSDIITLDITVNLSSVVGTPPVTTVNQVNGITTNQSNLTTRVHVPDGWFVCLTGQLLDTKTRAWNGIPCLGGLPVIGAAFSNTSRSNTRSNLMVFIRPEIIKTFEDYKRISQNQEDLLKDRSGRAVHREEIDEGFNWVKTPENE